MNVVVHTIQFVYLHVVQGKHEPPWFVTSMPFHSENGVTQQTLVTQRKGQVKEILIWRNSQWYAAGVFALWRMRLPLTQGWRFSSVQYDVGGRLQPRFTPPGDCLSLSFLSIKPSWTRAIHSFINNLISEQLKSDQSTQTQHNNPQTKNSKHHCNHVWQEQYVHNILSTPPTHHLSASR